MEPERELRRSDSASPPRSMASSDSLKKHGKANQTAKPSNTSLQEVTESLATTACLREHLNRLFDNPSSPSETIALPGRCCCNCGRPTMPSEDSSPTELVQRMKRTRKTEAQTELADALVEWRLRKQHGTLYPDFVFPRTLNRQACRMRIFPRLD